MLDEYKMVVMMVFSCSTGGWHRDFFHSSLDYLSKALEMLTSKSFVSGQNYQLYRISAAL
jgi:hypothetical protein